MWLPRSLHDLLGNDPDLLDEGALQALIGQSEGAELEFKREMWSDSKNEELALDIAQFANLGGGVIIVGARDSDGELAEFVPLELSEGDELRVQSVVASRIFPRLTIHTRRIAFVGEGLGSTRHVLLISVPPGDLKPHAVSDRHRLSYAIRAGGGKDYLSEHEVAEQHATRQESRSQVQERLGSRMATAESEFVSRGMSGAALVFAAVPAQAGEQDLTQISARDIQRYTLEAFVPRNDWNLHSPRSGFRSIRFEQDYDASVCEFSLDGSGHAVEDLDLGDEGGIRAERIAIYALNFLSLFSRHALECRATGSLLLACRVFGHRDQTASLRMAPQYGGGWASITLPTPTAGRDFPISALVAGGSELFNAWQLVASDLMSPFGFATPIPLNHDGELNPRSYLGPWRNDFAALDFAIAEA